MPEERELMQQIASGNESAYTLVFNKYSKHVFNVAMLYVKDTTTAHEIVQEVFLKVWLKREVMSAIKNFEDYLFILTRNHIYDNLKKQAVRTKAYDYLLQHQPAAVNDTDYRLREHQYENLLNKAVSALPPERKKVYMARNEGLSNEEVSNQLNISIHTVKKQMKLAMQSVRTFIKQQLS